MKRIITLLLIFVISSACFAQSNDLYKDSKPVPTNAPELEFPMVDSQLRAIFRVEAPDAQKVQLDLKEAYDMVEGEDGVWTVTTKPLDPGFYYYYLMIDGYRFSNPANEALKKIRIHNTYFESKGTAHEWLTWPRYLYEFAPLLFRK